jgi:putative colanic acid biosynthesis acetyltransferase WcaF
LRSPVQLNLYQTSDYAIGAGIVKQILWYFIGFPLVQSYLLPFSFMKVWLLKRFGAQIGKQVRIKTGVKIKFPWRLKVGDFVWIGEDAWIDNLAQVTIEDHVCLSQAVYLCTGNHNWKSEKFDLITKEIYLEAGCWVAARANVAPGVRMGYGSILTLGSSALKDLEPLTIYAGNPAIAIKKRIFVSDIDPKIEIA